MAVVCPRCTNLYEPSSGVCPRCGATTPKIEPDHAVPGRGPRWQQTAWGRILIGLILSQGLFYGLRHLLTGLFLASGGSSQQIWEDVKNILLLQGIQVFGVLLGAVLAGGGQRNGLLLGALVGAWNGVLGVMLRQNPAQDLTVVGLYGQPLLQAAVGAFGGWLGALIWAPIPAISVPVGLNPTRRKPKRPQPSPFAGKVAWFRVLAGAAFSVAGTLSATMIFQKMLDVSGGRLGTTHELQDRIITMELKALALIVGGALAGATTSNGLKQGLFVGFGASMVLIGVQAPQTDRWFEFAILNMVATFSLSMVGGWFGGQLFPPVIKLDRRRTFGLPSW